MKVWHVVLLVLLLGGGGWYLYNKGVIKAPMKKVEA